MAAQQMEKGTFPPLFDVGSVWRTLWQRRLTVLASVGVTVLLAVLYLAVTKPTYTATASILIDPRDARSTRFESVLPGIGPDSAAVASQVFVIESRDLLMAVFESEGLAGDPEFTDGGLLAFLGSGGTGKDAAFKRFEKRISVERAGLTYVIEVSVKSEAADKAARIANAIVDYYKAGLAGDRESANSDVSALLADRVGTLQRNVAEAERAVGDFKVRHGLLDAAAGGTLQSQIDQLTVQVIAARVGSDQAKDKFDQAAAAGASPAGLARLSQIVSSDAIDTLRTDYNQRAAALASAETVYQSRHPTIRRLRSELEKTAGLIGAEAGRIKEELNAKYDLSTQTVAALEAKLETLREKSRAADAARVELRRLEATAQAARTVLDDVLKRAEETSQMRGLQLSEAKVIGFAAPPVQPTWPTPLLLLPVSAALGLLVGCGVAILRGPVEKAERDPGPEPDEAAVTQLPARFIPTRSEAVPINLGRYELPGLASAGASSRIRAMRRRFLQRGGEAFSQETLKLVRRILALLTEHAPPYVLLVFPLRNGPDAKLAGAMIGIGLQQAGQKVLVVEVSDTAPELGAGVFINGASGLPTLVRAFDGEKGRRTPFTVGAGLADASDYDFVLLLGPPLTDADWDAALFPDVECMLFVLDAADDVAELNGLLRQRLGNDGVARSAVLVLASERVAGAANDTIVRWRGSAR
ncbi:exopolysaccharide biosynthesis protein [Shinella kummerowiae]|uniref:Exopolysaccharide biosynthesis protein n=1 Tax=Shinella kummerowiae TaxID=417745 RepID=A0A6N8SKR9_9HYPH|nr:GumC family protein [Shinella kummerowiae]MXN48937.1 exopolysaccharide biosynthesis protein [Shinella kummerowiae]